MRGGRRSLLLAIAGLATACAEPPPGRVDIELLVDDGAGTPVEGAAFLVDGERLAATDAHGRARAGLPIRTSATYRVAHACPAGFRPVEPEARLNAAPSRPLARRAPGSAAVTIRRRCAPLRLRHVLLVRTGGRGGLPIRVLGRTAGVTDPDGAALLAIDGAPGEEVEISLDTSAAPQLRPASPSRRIELPDARRFLVFDQRFEERPKPHGKRGRPRNVPRRL